MTGSMLNIIFVTIAFSLLTFALVFIIVSAIGADKIAAEKRLEELTEREGDGSDLALIKHESKREKARKEREQRKHSSAFEKFGSAIYKQLQSADIKMRPEEFLIVWILLALVPGCLSYLFTMNPILLIGLIIAGSVLPIIYIKSKQKSRVKKFDEQLCDALMIACSCLRSGLSFNQAMETIAKDMPAPVSTEFEMALREMNMGYSMDEALDNMNKRIDSKFLKLMVSAVLVQRQTGGNLSKILENISDTIKDKMKLQRELKTSTASGKMSGYIVGAMPFVMVGLFMLVARDFVSVLFTDTRGYFLLGGAIALDALAFASIKKITSVKM